jgi:Flp pilus assembly protein TadD
MYFYLGRYQDAEKMYRKATELAPSDHRMWSNLGDALNQMSGREKDAVAAYQHAISLARLELSVNSKDPENLSKLAYYYARVGDRLKARDLAAQASAIGSDSIYVHYYVSLTLLEDGNVKGAMDALEKAVELGYPVQLVRTGPEFIKLREDKRFQRLIASKDRHGAG